MTTPEPTMLGNRCARCGEPAPVLETGLSWHPVIRNRLCFACVELEADETRNAQRQTRVADLLRSAGGAPRWRHWSLDTYPTDELGRRAKADATRWFEALLYGGASSNLLLVGGVGSGKTGLAWSLVRAACEEELSAVLVNFRDYLAALRRSFTTGEQVDERWRSIKLLALDDLGAERPTDFARDELLRLVEHRYRHELPIIVTSNYPLSQLGRRLGHDDVVIGQRIVSRLADGAVQVRFADIDRRRVRAA